MRYDKIKTVENGPRLFLCMSIRRFAGPAESFSAVWRPEGVTGKGQAGIFRRGRVSMKMKRVIAAAVAAVMAALLLAGCSGGKKNVEYVVLDESLSDEQYRSASARRIRPCGTRCRRSSAR